ncbi:MAG: anaerobic C4-dicarboxylate transporter family protein, partial [Burkholderiaceae bacterium]
MFDLSPAFELLIFLSAIVWGARFGGLGLGMAGGTILCVLVLGGGTHPAPPPVDVMLIIMAVVTAAACLEGGGGGRYLIAVAERVLRRHPHRIALLAPASTYLATALCGTGYVSVALFRVISEVSIQAGIRPERPLSAALIAIQQAILVSPVSAATAALLAVLLPLGISWAEILLITLPATLLGSAAAVAAAAWRRSDLPPAPTMAAPPEAVAPIQPHERRALWAFVATVAVAIAVSACDTLRPQWSAGEQTVRLGVASALQIVMLGGSLFIAWAGRASSEAILETRVFRSGMMGAVSIFGIVWASDTL